MIWCDRLIQCYKCPFLMITEKIDPKEVKDENGVLTGKVKLYTKFDCTRFNQTIQETMQYCEYY